MALGGQVQVDHGGGERAVAEILLDAADIDAGLQQVGGVGVAQGVDGDAFLDLELREHAAQRPLHGGFIHGLAGRRGPLCRCDRVWGRSRPDCDAASSNRAGL